jgi:hypothetical protein
VKRRESLDSVANDPIILNSGTLMSRSTEGVTNTREMKRCDRFENEGRQAGPHSSPHKSAAVERDAHRLEVGASETRRRVVRLIKS